MRCVDEITLAQKSSGSGTSNPFLDEGKRFGNPKQKYHHLNNASTTFRSLVANMSYGTDVILPMNSKEAADVARVFEQRGADIEMYKVKRPPFPSPLSTNGVDVNPDDLRELDDALWRLRQYNYLRLGIGRTSFNYPITFGEEGGLVVGTGENNSIACFTSSVDPDKEAQLLEEFGDASLGIIRISHPNNKDYW